MPGNNGSNGRNSRRDVLKTIGAGVGVAGIGTSLTAARHEPSQFKKDVRRAIEIRREADEKAAKVAENIRQSGKPNAKERARNYRVRKPKQAWETYLRSKGYGVVQQTQRYAFDDKDNSDGPSAQKVDSVDTMGIDATLSMTTDGYEYCASLAFQLYFSINYEYDSGLVGNCYNTSYGEDPLDTCGMGWKGECWKYNTDNLAEMSESSDNVTYEDSAYSLSGFGWEVDDAQIFQDWKNDGNDCSSSRSDEEGYSALEDANLFLYEEDDPNCNGNDDTYILGVYDHTWKGTYNNFSVGVSYPYAVSVSYSQTSSLKHESTKTEKDGETALQVSRDEAVDVGNL
ncbi:twin-arginine translocation signal domain-containing protein [Halorussus ruber]|uniref:twin-arginine translocation signal domain-containing protein n=1 Tax=Halorussus ruber TaxID=1126238 RepID=UPI0010920343|nr:twin-arginine translocation signal domain-containing protein [Halorussus ruber]